MTHKIIPLLFFLWTTGLYAQNLYQDLFALEKERLRPVFFLEYEDFIMKRIDELPFSLVPSEKIYADAGYEKGSFPKIKSKNLKITFTDEGYLIEEFKGKNRIHKVSFPYSSVKKVYGGTPTQFRNIRNQPMVTFEFKDSDRDLKSLINYEGEKMMDGGMAFWRQKKKLGIFFKEHNSARSASKAFEYHRAIGNYQPTSQKLKNAFQISIVADREAWKNEVLPILTFPINLFEDKNYQQEHILFLTDMLDWKTKHSVRRRFKVSENLSKLREMGYNDVFLLKNQSLLNPLSLTNKIIINGIDPLLMESREMIEWSPTLAMIHVFKHGNPGLAKRIFHEHLDKAGEPGKRLMNAQILIDLYRKKGLSSRAVNQYLSIMKKEGSISEDSARILRPQLNEQFAADFEKAGEELEKKMEYYKQEKIKEALTYGTGPDKKEVINNLFQIALLDDDEAWSVLFDLDYEAVLTEKEASFVADMDMLKQRSFYLLKTQYSMLLNGYFGGYPSAMIAETNQLEKAELCYFAEAHAINYNFPKVSPSDSLFAFLMSEITAVKRLRSMASGVEQKFWLGALSATTAPSRMDIPTDRYGNILVDEEEYQQIIDRNREAAEGEREFLGGIANMYFAKARISQLNKSYLVAKKKAKDLLHKNYASELRPFRYHSNKLVREMDLHCKTKEAEAQYEEWFVKEYLEDKTKKYDATQIAFYRRNERYIDLAKALFNNGAATQKDKQDLMLKALNEGKIHLLRLLMDRGVDPNMMLSYKQGRFTALHYIAYNSKGNVRYEMASILIENGANKKLRDHLGKTPAESVNMRLPKAAKIAAILR